MSRYVTGEPPVPLHWHLTGCTSAECGLQIYDLAAPVDAWVGDEMTRDPLSPQWEDCKVCGGDHWTKDHPDLRLPPEKQGPMPPDRPSAAERLIESIAYMGVIDIHQQVCAWCGRRYGYPHREYCPISVQAPIISAALAPSEPKP